MKKFYLVLTFLLAVVTVFLLSPVSLAAVHHANVQPQAGRRTYVPGTAYYTFSALVTAGSNASTIGAVNSEGGLTLYVKQDGSFFGTVTANPSSVHNVGGSFQPDGSIQLNIPFGLGTIWQSTARPRGHGEFVGTFTVSYAGVTSRSGIWALAPISNPQNVLAHTLSALITAGPDQNIPLGGVIIMDLRRLSGTLHLPDGNSVTIFMKTTQNNAAFTIVLNGHSFIAAVGTATVIGTVTRYTGTFVGPRPGDSGTWSSYLFTFAS